MSVFRDAFEQCPRCGLDLVDARSARGCRRCAGMWLDEQVLTEMVQRMLPPGMFGNRLEFTGLVEHPGDKLGCPTCHDPMTVASLHGILVDRCAKHGIWFDAEELGVVLRRTADPYRWPSVVDAPTVVERRAPDPPPPETARPGVPMLRFAVLRGGVTSQVEVRREVIKLGRLPTAHVRLADDSGANRMHAVIDATSVDDVVIIDLGSTIGTEVNGERIAKAMLRSGDRLHIGDTMMTVEILP